MSRTIAMTVMTKPMVGTRVQKLYVIHVPPATFKKLKRVEGKLAKQGIVFGRVARKAAGPDPWQIAEHIWLAVQIGK